MLFHPLSSFIYTSKYIINIYIYEIITPESTPKHFPHLDYTQGLQWKCLIHFSTKKIVWANFGPPNWRLWDSVPPCCHSPCVSTFLLITDSKPTKLQRVQTAGQHHRRYVLLGLVPECTADKHRLAGDTIKGV